MVADQNNSRGQPWVRRPSQTQSALGAKTRWYANQPLPTQQRLKTWLAMVSSSGIHIESLRACRSIIFKRNQEQWFSKLIYSLLRQVMRMWTRAMDIRQKEIAGHVWETGWQNFMTDWRAVEVGGEWVEESMESGMTASLLAVPTG